MSACNAFGCGFAVEEILVTIDNGDKKVTLCPNHIAMFANTLFDMEKVYTEPSKSNDNHPCECCGEEKSITYKDRDAIFYLCKAHLSDLINLNLSPNAFKTLYQKHGNIYILHDDFYDETVGEALQPIRDRRGI
jgi:hypothetical protein